jgi:1-phosphofructokinase family hexose kinase
MLFDSVQRGEVNRAADVHWCASGKVLNVGQALSRLGAEATILSLLGGASGQAIAREFAEQESSYCCRCRWVWSKNPTRVCTTLLERGSGSVTELVENAAPASAAELEAFREAYRAEAASAEVAVLTGSLPAGTPPTLFRELLEFTAGQAILDVRGAELRHALECRPLIVKPNRAELAATLGRALDRDDDLLAAMRELNRLGATWVLVSHGSRPVWLSSLNATYRISLPSVSVINPIGSGDCLAAGIAWGLSERCDILESARLGLAAAMENATQLLPARLDAERVRQQATALVVERVA